MRTFRPLLTQYTPRQVQIQRHWPIQRRWISSFQANLRTLSRKKAKRNHKALQKPRTCDHHPKQPPHRKLLRRYTEPTDHTALTENRTTPPSASAPDQSSNSFPQRSIGVYPESLATKNHSTKPSNTTKTPWNEADTTNFTYMANGTPHTLTKYSVTPPQE